MLNKIKNKYILKQIIHELTELKYLKLVKYNKTLQKKLSLSVHDYNNYRKIIIEIKPISEDKLNKNDSENKFINLPKDKSLYHIYFDNSKEESNIDYIKKGKKVGIITIMIDKEVTSLKDLFYGCKCIEEIKFTNFKYNNITDMSYMFNCCTNLKKLDINKFKTKNVTDMSNMFRLCESLEELDASNLITDNVIDMKSMFYCCSNLKRLNLSNFNTDKVKNMMHMFSGCSKLIELNLSNFKINNCENMRYMFNECSSLEILDISKFDIYSDEFDKNENNNLIIMKRVINSSKFIGLFDKCSKTLKQKIREQKPEFNDRRFINSSCLLLKRDEFIS